MFLDGHNLYAVVTTGNHTRQHLLAEFVIGRHTLLLARHAHVTFVDEQWGGIGLELLHLELIGCRLPHLSTEEIGGLILYHTTDVCRDALARATVPIDLQLVVILVLDSIGRKLHLPVTMTIETSELVLLLLLPPGKVTYEIYLCSVGGPLTEGPTLLCPVQAIVFVAFGHILQLLRAIGSQFILTTYIVVIAALNRRFIRFQPRVVFNKFKHGFISLP